VKKIINSLIVGLTFLASSNAFAFKAGEIEVLKVIPDNISFLKWINLNPNCEIIHINAIINWERAAYKNDINEGMGHVIFTKNDISCNNKPE
jgi:hypothetical protein